MNDVTLEIDALQNRPTCLVEIFGRLYTIDFP